MSTPQPDPLAQMSVINWYFGPTAWDPRPDGMWHAQCPDPYATGHDGEVWLDHHRGAFCSGCRHYEPGQAEQDIPPERAAELPAPVKPSETPPTVAASSPSPEPAASDAGSPAEAAASDAVSTPEGAAAVTSSAAAASPAPVEHPGILGRIKDALEGTEGSS